MMTNEQYSEFRKKINPIIKACSVSEDKKESVKPHLATCHGASTFTMGKVFYFDARVAMQYQDALLDICRELPKLDAVIPGSACTISSLKLIKETSNQAILKSQFEAAEKFFVLLTLAEISTFRPVNSQDNITYINADIRYKFKDRVT